MTFSKVSKDSFAKRPLMLDGEGYDQADDIDRTSAANSEGPIASTSLASGNRSIPG